MIREKFPLPEENYQDGKSDGVKYTLIFNGTTLKVSYDMVRSFLEEEGYEDIPVPKDVAELSLFRHPVSNIRQILLFDDNGYCHNPIKILFPLDRRKKRTLYLIIYNENAADHILRFHNKLDRKIERRK
jgi:hypothetical protein